MPQPLRAETCRKPWEYAKVIVRSTAIIPVLVGDVNQRLSYKMEEFMDAFGSEQGRLLYSEFECIVACNVGRDGVHKDSRMKVYVAIWRVLGTSWERFIASVERPRDASPPACKRPFSFMLLLNCS